MTVKEQQGRRMKHENKKDARIANTFEPRVYVMSVLHVKKLCQKNVRHGVCAHSLPLWRRGP